MCRRLEDNTQTTPKPVSNMDSFLSEGKHDINSEQGRTHYQVVRHRPNSPRSGLQYVDDSLPTHIYRQLLGRIKVILYSGQAPLHAHQENMTLMAPVLARFAAMSNPLRMSCSEKPSLWVIKGSVWILPSSSRLRHKGHCRPHQLASLSHLFNITLARLAVSHTDVTPPLPFCPCPLLWS